MKLILQLFLATTFVFSTQNCKGQEKVEKELYTYKKGSYDGIGKWYMGREIAHVMGFQGMGWLERPEREAEESTSTLIENMVITPNTVIADIGAGSGYHVFKMAAIARDGEIYAVDIQEEMLAAINQKKERTKVNNITTIKGSPKSVNLPKNRIDKVLMVDVYHEFDFPVEMMKSIKTALKADGQIYLIEYRGEDGNVPIKKLHKMTEAQAVKEMTAIGFELKENISNLPWQHCMVFINSSDKK